MKAVASLLLLARLAASQSPGITLLSVEGGLSPALGPSDRAPRFVAPGMPTTVQATGIPMLPGWSLPPPGSQMPVEFNGVAAYYRMFPTAGVGESPGPESVVAMPIYGFLQSSERCYPRSLAPECIATTLLVQVPYFEREEVRDGHLRRHDIILRLGELSSDPLDVVPVFVMPRLEKRFSVVDSGTYNDFAWGYVLMWNRSYPLMPGSSVTMYASGLGVTDPPAPFGEIPEANVAHRPVAKFLLRFTWVVDGGTPPEPGGTPVARSGVIEPDIRLVNAPTRLHLYGEAGSHQFQFTVPPMPAGTAKCNSTNRYYNLILILGPDPAANRFAYPNEYRSDVINLCVGPYV